MKGARRRENGSDDDQTNGRRTGRRRQTGAQASSNREDPKGTRTRPITRRGRFAPVKANADALEFNAAALAYMSHLNQGVATALGAGLALAPATTLLLAAIWALVMWRWKISALASIVAIVSGPIISALIEPDTLPLFGLLAILIVVRHRNNLIRMAQGREPGF